MYNVAFINVDKIEDDFQSSENQIFELMVLVNNIFNVSVCNTNIISLICDEITEDKKYKIALLESFFKVLTIRDPKYIFAGTLTNTNPIIDFTDAKDISSQIALQKVVKENARLEKKQLSLLNNIGLNNIENIIHITNGVDFFLHDDLKDANNIVMTNGYENASDGVVSNTSDPHFAYYLAQSTGLKGYNDCFASYFVNRETIKLSNRNN